MILEAVRIFADWCGDATYGVNALLPTVPREDDVALPADVDVRDETRNGQCARDQVPDDLDGNGLLWSTADAVDAANPGNRPFPPDASVTVMVRFATSNKDTEVANRDASVTLRALWRSLGKLMTTTEGETARSRSFVQLINIERLQLQTFYSPSKDVTVTGGALVTCRMRDLFASAQS